MTTADYVLLAANMLIVIPISVLMFVMLDPGSPLGMTSRRLTQLIVSAAIAAAGVWMLAIGSWPVTIFLLLWLMRRHVLELWLRRRLSHRSSAVLYAAITLGFFGLPAYSEFQVADPVGRLAIIVLTTLGLLGAYGVAVFLLRSLGGEYDQAPTKTDVRPPRAAP